MKVYKQHFRLVKGNVILLLGTLLLGSACSWFWSNYSGEALALQSISIGDGSNHLYTTSVKTVINTKSDINNICTLQNKATNFSNHDTIGWIIKLYAPSDVKVTVFSRILKLTDFTTVQYTDVTQDLERGDQSLNFCVKLKNVKPGAYILSRTMLVFNKDEIQAKMLDRLPLIIY